MPRASWLPANHRSPTKEELQAQVAREEEASALGRLKAAKELEKRKESMDYSRSFGGKKLFKNAIELVAPCI